MSPEGDTPVAHHVVNRYKAGGMDISIENMIITRLQQAWI